MGRDLSLYHKVQNGSWSHPNLLPIGYQGLFPRWWSGWNIKQDCSRLIQRSWNVQSFTFTPLYLLALLRHRANFVFTFTIMTLFMPVKSIYLALVFCNLRHTVLYDSFVLLAEEITICPKQFVCALTLFWPFLDYFVITMKLYTFFANGVISIFIFNSSLYWLNIRYLIQ